MKKLQNNFTTPEQSKRLLELGVPADSADCYYTGNYCLIWVKSDVDKIDWNAKVGSKNFYIPCWSVGRLMDIICNCHVITNQFMENWICCDKDTNLIELLISDIEVYIAAGHIDFSKLEE